MKNIRNTLMEILSYVMAAILVAALFIVPTTVLIGCFKLITMMFGG